MPYLALGTLDDTERLAAALAPLLADRDVLELVGEIGAGKTTFVGGLARALGSTEPARSPTYTVAHAYELPGGARLVHLDCYRAHGTLDEAAWGDLEPYFESGIACVEWPEPVRPWLADRRTWRLEFERVDGAPEGRVVRIDAPAGALPAALRAIAALPDAARTAPE